MDVPADCTLPAADRPLRVAELARLFRTARRVDRVGAARLRVTFAPDRAAQVRDLVARESRCCAFFAFTVTARPGHVLLDVGVPAPRADVLDGLVELAGGAR